MRQTLSLLSACPVIPCRDDAIPGEVADVRSVSQRLVRIFQVAHGAAELYRVICSRHAIGQSLSLEVFANKEF
jgi:hypothetical protein